MTTKVDKPDSSAGGAATSTTQRLDPKKFQSSAPLETAAPTPASTISSEASIEPEPTESPVDAAPTTTAMSGISSAVVEAREMAPVRTRVGPPATVARAGRPATPRTVMTLEEMRVSIASSLKWSYWVLVVAIPTLIGFMLFLLSGGLGVAKETIDRLALVSSLQVGLGMFLGFMCLYFGVMMTWIGIDAAYDLTATGQATERQATLALRSASPGLFFGLIGAILIGTSLYKTIEFNETRPVSEKPLNPASGNAPNVLRLENQQPTDVKKVTPDMKVPKIGTPETAKKNDE